MSGRIQHDIATGVVFRERDTVTDRIEAGKQRDPTVQTVSQTTVRRCAVGERSNQVTELLLGAGIVMKSCVGTAGLVVLVLISLVPLLKALCLAFFYKLAAAVTEPVSDKRISGCLKGLANGGMLYVKLLGYSVLLFFVTIALTAAASGFIY